MKIPMKIHKIYRGQDLTMVEYIDGTTDVFKPEQLISRQGEFIIIAVGLLLFILVVIF